MDNALSALRKNTLDLHNQLQSSVPFVRLMSTNPSQDDYLQVLQILLHCYRIFENPLRQRLQQYIPDYDYVPRLPLLHRDLLQFQSIGYLSEVVETFELNSQAQMLGMLYVVEGSVLGSKKLTDHLQNHLNSEKLHAMAFYTLDGNIDRHDWNTTQTVLCRNLLTADDIRDAVDGARQLFRLFINATDHCKY